MPAKKTDIPHLSNLPQLIFLGKIKVYQFDRKQRQKTDNLHLTVVWRQIAVTF